jgi:Putative transposase/Transposase zinc-binding domain
MTLSPSPQPPLEVADVVRAHGSAFLARYGSVLSSTQRRALRDLAVCRTAALGGHVSHCLDCGHDRIAYNSCRNRHCPKCQALTRARWLAREAEHVLPVAYHHVVFTLPAELSELALANPRLLYDLLFRAASVTLRLVAANPKRLGAVVGALLVLHTWGQTLQHHPHVHAVVSGGGLSCTAAGVIDPNPRWVSCRPGFFLPVRVLSRVFRSQFVGGLQAAFDQGRLRFPGRLAGQQQPVVWAKNMAALLSKEWVVYSKPPFGGPAQVLKYLARYAHGVAIGNRRLAHLSDDGQVTFRYKDYADAGRDKAMTLPAVEFLRRFVQHVLPRGFVKVRHYGLLANRQRAVRLEQSRRLLLVATVAERLGADAVWAVEPAPRPCCPHCGSERLVYLGLPPEPAAVAATGKVLAGSATASCSPDSS